MPRLAMTDEDKVRKKLAYSIRQHQLTCGLTDEEVAKNAGMSEYTFRDKLERPTKRYFTQPELLRIFRQLCFSDAEILSVMKM